MMIATATRKLSSVVVVVFSSALLASTITKRRSSFSFTSAFTTPFLVRTVSVSATASGSTCPTTAATKSTTTRKMTATTAANADAVVENDNNVDPHKFLEDVLSDESMEWVKKQNEDCIAKYGDPTSTKDYRRILDILDSKDKIPSVAQIGDAKDGMYYNFWQDENHVQGIWRKTTLDSYKTKQPVWETVLDLDALEPPKTDTAETWVWHGSTLLDEGPTSQVKDRAIIKLSPGGSDADIFREFDLIKQEFIDPNGPDHGFELTIPTKCRVSYRSRDELLIGTDFEKIDPSVKDSLTDSGYVRTMYSWKRGTPLKDAKIVFDKALKSDIAGYHYAYHDRDGICHEFQGRSITFYTSEYYYRSITLEQLLNKTADDPSLPEFEKIPIPLDAEIGTFGNDAMITLRSDWSPPGYKGEDDDVLPAGSLIVVPMKDVMTNDYSKSTCLFKPTSSKSLSSTTTTKDYVVLETLEDVRTSLNIWKKEDDGKWTLQESSSSSSDGVPIGEGIGFSNPNRDSSQDNRLFLWRDGFLIPDTLQYIEDVSDLLTEGNEGTTTKLKSKPSMFDSSGLTVDQNFATSKDGTKIPYFVIRRNDITYDGTNPTLVDAYGGFEISNLPRYSAAVGSVWLESGGIKVIANIRGGGEYGPKWHQAALKENRYKCYEDMEAVAQDLIDRKITSPSKMACIGGSNGGLMVGNLITRPISSKLFGAAVCQVPLLDMKRYSHLLAGASWMAEYGNPDTDEWKFLRNHSPYHLLRHDNLGVPEEGNDDGQKTIKNPDWICPKVLFTTSTRDDRVHPGHARKMVRALLEEAQPKNKAPEVFYWENTEGGHGGAADNKQRAHMWALTYSMLKQTLGL